MKILNWILAAMFLLFAIFQYNDPDPIQWAALYLLTMTVCILAALNKSNKYLIAIGLVISVIWAISLSPDFFAWVKEGMPTVTGTMKAENPHIELVREFGGLFIAAITFGWQAWQMRVAGINAMR
jgi:hypothetical protein